MLVGKRVGKKRKMKILKGVTGALKPVPLMQHIATASKTTDLSLSKAYMPGLYIYCALITAHRGMLLYTHTLIDLLIVHSMGIRVSQALHA